MKSRAAAGFTLLEVAVALAILGAGVVTCLQIFSASLRLQSRASRETRAVLMARAAIDQLLVRQDLENAATCLPTDTQGFTTCIEVGDAGPEDGIVLPEEADPNSLPVIPKRLAAVVTWNDGSGAKTYTVRTLRLLSNPYAS